MHRNSISHSTLATLGAFLIFVLLTTSTAMGDDSRKEIIISVSPGGWPPYIIPTCDEGKNHGIMIDVMNEIAAKAGAKTVITCFPAKRSPLLLKEGRVDAMVKAKEWMVTPSFFHWTAPVVESSDVLVCRKGECPDTNNPETLADRRVGVVRGYGYPTLAPYFNDGTIRRFDATTTENLIRMVHRGHIDVAVTNRLVAEWIIRNSDDMKAEAFSFSDQPIASAPYRFAFAKADQWDRFIHIFNHELEIMKKDGRLQAILDKYK